MYRRHFVALLASATLVPLITGAADESSMDHPAAYCVHDIGQLPDLPPGVTDVNPAALNNRNQVVGTIFSFNIGRAQAFIWQRGRGMRDLGVLSGHDNANASDINDAGQVVGVSFNFETGDQQSFRWTQRRGLQELDASLGANRHAATGVNRFGQVVGASSVDAFIEHAYLLDTDGDVLDLGVLPDGNPDTVATAVNDLADVVGVDSGGALFSQVFLWDKRNGMRSIIKADRVSFLAHGINNRREVVGGRFGNDITRPFLWTSRGGLQDLGSLGGQDTDWGEAMGINQRGAIVGWSQTATGAGRGFIWTRRTGMRNLNDMIDPTSPAAAFAILGAAKAINDFGWIVVEGLDSRNPDLGSRGFLLEPRRGQSCR